jgi:hypothetical protein
VKAIFEKTNEMQAAGVIGKYAIGGAVESAEHLVAIALRTGRPRDHARILQFIEQSAFDRPRLQSILKRHGLLSKWEQFESRYLGGTLE